MTPQQQLEQYHLLWRENENRLNHLSLLKTLAETDAPDPRLLPEIGPVFAASQTPTRGCTGTLSAAAVSRAQHLTPDLQDPALPLILTDRKARAEMEYKRYLEQIGPLLEQNRLRMEALEAAVRRLTDLCFGKCCVCAISTVASAASPRGASWPSAFMETMTPPPFSTSPASTGKPSPPSPPCSLMRPNPPLPPDFKRQNQTAQPHKEVF